MILPRLRCLPRAALYVGLALAWTWALLVLSAYPLLPAWAGLALSAVWVATTIALVARRRRFERPRRAVSLAFAVGVVLVWVALRFARPSNAREWSPDQSRIPHAIFDGERVTIENVRFARYRSVDDYDVAWETRTYDLSTVRDIDYVVESFASSRGPAHVFLTFGFDNGEHLAISVEIRRERGEEFSAIGGLARNYELCYVAGDERDVIGLRVVHRRSPVRIYPIDCTPAIARAVFESMLRRANRLRESPEFYDTLTNTCYWNIVRHAEELGLDSVPIDIRALLPGYSDEVALELGLLDFDGDIETARERFRVVDGGEPREGESGAEWSARIRRVGSSR